MALNWLLPQYQQNLLRVLFENPSTPLHISELARRARIDSGNAQRYLKEFARHDLVKLNKTSKMTFVSPNFSNPEIAKIFEFFEVDRCQSFLKTNQTYCQILSALTNALVSTIDSIQMVALFGSCTQIDRTGKPVFGSSIDLAIVVTNGFNSNHLKKRVEKIIREHGLPLNISPSIIKTKDFEAEWKNCSTFCCDLWRERIILYGEWYLWNQVARQGVPK
ncbi:MAG: hypothetical protein WA148_00300 [Actinomycetota bacterium]